MSAASDVERLKSKVRDILITLESVLLRLEQLEQHCWPLDAVSKNSTPHNQSGEFPKPVLDA